MQTEMSRGRKMCSREAHGSFYLYLKGFRDEIISPDGALRVSKSMKFQDSETLRIKRKRISISGTFQIQTK